MPDLPPPPVAAPSGVDRWRPAVERILAQRGRLVALAGGALAAAVAMAIAVAAWRPSPPPVEFSLPWAAGPDASPGGAGAGGQPPPGPGSAGPGAAGDAYVHAAGAVARPGVYRVRAGGRVADVIDAAGGPAPEADLDRLNLAARVVDGQRVYVPRRGEAMPAGDGGAVDGDSAARDGTAALVDLNTASMEELDRLPGIGPATAQAILDLRRRKGRFRAVDELLEVRGIGEAKLAELRPRVRV